MNLLSINYIVWLVLSAIFFAICEFLSKKYALSPKTSTLIYILIINSLAVLVWLPAIMQKNQLSIVGVMWSVMSLLATFLIGILLFKEKLNLTGVVGIIFAFISIILLSQG